MPISPFNSLLVKTTSLTKRLAILPKKMGSYITANIAEGTRYHIHYLYPLAISIPIWLHGEGIGLSLISG